MRILNVSFTLSFLILTTLVLDPTASIAADTTPPTAPTGLSATTISSSQINLTWTASTDNVGVSGYRVERCDGAFFGSCSPYVQIATPGNTTFNDTGLAEFSMHTYRVRAADAAGNLSAYSGTVTAKTSDVTPPTAPGGLAATAASVSQINLSWSPSTDNDAVAAYDVQRCQGAGCTVFAHVAYVSIAQGGRSFIDTALAVATYQYRLRAIDRSGNVGSFSNVASAATSSTADTSAPSAPTGLSATASVANQLTLNWTASSDNIGVAIYRLERCQGTNCTAFIEFATSTAPPFWDSGLARAATYRYRIRAADAAGNLSGYSSVASATTLNAADTTAPSSPANLVALAVSSSQINLTWTASTDNAGVTSYRVMRCTTPVCLGPSSFSQIGSATGTAFSDTGLAPKTQAQYFLYALDAAGNTAASTVAVATTLDTSSPTTPGSLTATAVSASRINLSWTASTDSSGIASYQVVRCQDTNCPGMVQVGTAPATTFSDAGLTAGARYSYQVRAVNTGGAVSAYSDVASATTPYVSDTTPPSAPSGLVATVANPNQINLTWTASTDDTGVTGYQLERCQGAGCATFVQAATTTGASFGDTTVSTGATYSYRVRATDAAGNLSVYSNVASATTSNQLAQIYYITPDHLNTPRLISNQQGTTVWRWDQGEPFGNDVPNSNPSGAGAFDFPLRFPGQYFDKETNLSYNYFRDYDPAIGAYKQSDPMSVGERVMRRQARLRSARGVGQNLLQLNSYAYVNANPLRWRDPSGRDFELVIGEILLIAHEGAVAGLGVTAAGAAGYGLGTGANYLCSNCFGDFGIWIYNTSHPDPSPLPQVPDPLAPLDPLQIPQAPDPLAPLVPLPDPLAPIGPPAPPVSCRP